MFLHLLQSNGLLQKHFQNHLEYQCPNCQKRCPQQKVKTIKAFCDDSSIVLQMNFSENATITARFSLLYNTDNFDLEISYLKAPILLDVQCSIIFFPEIYVFCNVWSMSCYFQYRDQAFIARTQLELSWTTMLMQTEINTETKMAMKSSTASIARPQKCGMQH